EASERAKLVAWPSSRANRHHRFDSRMLTQRTGPGVKLAKAKRVAQPTAIDNSADRVNRAVDRPLCAISACRRHRWRDPRARPNETRLTSKQTAPYHAPGPPE